MGEKLSVDLKKYSSTTVPLEDEGIDIGNENRDTRKILFKKHPDQEKKTKKHPPQTKVI